MTVLSGRRRVGKTALALEFAQSRRHLTCSSPRSRSPSSARSTWRRSSGSSTCRSSGRSKTFRDIFRLLLELSKKEPFTLIVDEFQEFLQINPAVYSENPAPLGHQHGQVPAEPDLHRVGLLPHAPDLRGEERAPVRQDGTASYPSSPSNTDDS